MKNPHSLVGGKLYTQFHFVSCRRYFDNVCTPNTRPLTIKKHTIQHHRGRLLSIIHTTVHRFRRWNRCQMFIWIIFKVSHPSTWNCLIFVKIHCHLYSPLYLLFKGKWHTSIGLA